MLKLLLLMFVFLVLTTTEENSAKDSFTEFHHLHAHLRHLRQLEDKVYARMAELPSHYQMSGELKDEFHSIQHSLEKVRRDINQTFVNFQQVFNTSKFQQSQYQSIVQKQQEFNTEQSVQRQGIRAIDYETGQLKNITGLTIQQLNKLKRIERDADPAVLHYDFELLGEIAVLFGMAAAFGIFASFCSLPPTIGYLAGGAIIGPSGAGLVRQYTEIETISLFGSIFLLFAHGAEYSKTLMDNVFYPYFFGGVFYVTGVVTLIAFISASIGWTGTASEGIIFGVGACIASTSPLYHYISGQHLARTSFGRLVVGIVIVQDLLMSCVLAMPELLAATSVTVFLMTAVKTFCSCALVAAISVFLHRHVVTKLLVFLQRMESVHNSSLVLLGVVSVCLAFALATEFLGLSIESGAFFAGLAFIDADSMDIALTSIKVLDNLFGSLFFACIGMIINPIFLLEHFFQIVSVISIVCAVKIILGTSVIRAFGYPWSKGFQVALSLTQIGEFALIFMIKAQAKGLVPRRLYLLFVASTAILLGFSPLLHKGLSTSRKGTFQLQRMVHKRRQSMDEQEFGPSP